VAESTTVPESAPPGPSTTTKEVAALRPIRVRPPHPGLSIIVLVFIGTIAVGLVAGATAVVALPAIFGAVGFVLLQLGH
jgi:hypothetical protein